MAASSVVPKTSSVAMTAVSFAHCLLGVPNTSRRSELVSDSQFDNSDCDMQLLINTCLYGSANCFGSGLAQNPPFALIKLKHFSRGSWCTLVHNYFTPQTDFTSFYKTITALMDNCQHVMQCVAPLEPCILTRLNISVIMYKYSNEGLFSCNARLYSLTSCKPVLLKMSNNASMFFTNAAIWYASCVVANDLNI